MKCAWNDLLTILPRGIRNQVDKLGREEAQQLRLRVNAPPELKLKNRDLWLDGTVGTEDINYCINATSRYSPWAASTLSQGYLTAPGGHRIGVCGDAIVQNGTIKGIRSPTSVCIRIARDIPGVAEKLADLKGSVLILGAPGWGKTTLLRDLIRIRSNAGTHVCVVDEREELFPSGFDRGARTEVMTGCPKNEGLDMLLKTMGPETIALDEITSEKDCVALKQAAWCGVELLATAHAAGMRDYLHREIYRPLVQQNLFETIVILHRDKSWHLERSGTWTTNGSERY